MEKSKQLAGQAAVLIAIAEGDHPQQGESVLLTKRAAHLTLHRGEVALPGGMWEEWDETLMHTALRESEEEVGLAPSRVSIFDELPVSHTRAGMRVTPFAGRVDRMDGLVVNRGELDALFWVPVPYLIEDRRVRTDIFKIGGVEYWAPVYEWDGFKIWGFTARVLTEFLNRAYGANIERGNDAPEVLFRPD